MAFLHEWLGPKIPGAGQATKLRILLPSFFFATIQLQMEEVQVMVSGFGTPDIILISSEGEKLGVHTEFLKTGSTMFRSMLESFTSEMNVQMAEDANEIKLLIPFCYPVPAPTIFSGTKANAVVVDRVKLDRLLATCDKWGLYRGVENIVDLYGRSWVLLQTTNVQS